MLRIAVGILVGLVSTGFVALGLIAAWSLAHYRPYPMDGELVAHTVKAIQDIGELRTIAESLAFRKDLVSADFNQIFPVAGIAFMLASVIGSAGFSWIAYAIFRRKPAAKTDHAL